MPGQTVFGAVLERVPTAGGQWSAATPPAARRSPWSALVPLLLAGAIAAAAWFGYTYWYRPQVPLPDAVEAYVDGAGVAYVSPVTGIGGEFAGPPVEIRLAGGAPASAFTGDGFSIVVAAVPAPATPVDAAAAVEGQAPGASVRVGTAEAGGVVYAVAVSAADRRSADAVFDRLTPTLRLPGGATL